MYRPPVKMFIASVLPACGNLMLLCLCFMIVHTNAAPSPEPEPALYTVSAMPSIYSYTVTNQKQQQQQQQQLEQEQLLSNDIGYSSNFVLADNNNNNNNNYNYNSAKNNYYKSSSNRNNNNNNLINYTTNTQSYRNGNTNRNFYYTNTNSNSNTNSNNNINSNSNSNSNANFKDNSYTSSIISSASATASSSSTSSAFASSPAPAAPASGCNLDRLAVYKVVLHTYWTRDLFPKHYPDWRPSAQWTKTIGRTHDSSYALYHIGQQATTGVKQFAETGKFDILDSIAAQHQQQQLQKAGNSFTSFVPASSSGSQAKSMQEQSMQQQQQPLLQHGERSVFDEFSIPAITTGAGRSEAKFFVDSNHSLVSLMTRIVPSPDWFIGVDSFQLCVGGSWIDTVTVEMDPLDAGTDNGFTFTAPNWPTSPQGVIYRITSRYPAHPAGSFFYPKSKRLPPIATFQLIKLKEYDLSEVFNFAEDDRKYETVQTQTHLETEHNHVEMNNELSASIERERQNEVTARPVSQTDRDRIRSQMLAKMNPMSNTSSNGAQYAMNLNVVPKNDKHALMQNIAQSYRLYGGGGGNGFGGSIQTTDGKGGTSKRRRSKRQRDCRVSHWSEWSACSKTCGIGEMHRYRKVIKHGKRGGRPCPALQESKWCGSEKGCHKPSSYFNWSNT